MLDLRGVVIQSATRPDRTDSEDGGPHECSCDCSAWRRAKSGQLFQGLRKEDAPFYLIVRQQEPELIALLIDSRLSFSWHGAPHKAFIPSVRQQTGSCSQCAGREIS